MRTLTKKTQINVRFNDELITALRQYQVNEIAKRNKTISLHSLIIEAVEAAISKGQCYAALRLETSAE